MFLKIVLRLRVLSKRVQFYNRKKSFVDTKRMNKSCKDFIMAKVCFRSKDILRSVLKIASSTRLSSCCICAARSSLIKLVSLTIFSGTVLKRAIELSAFFFGLHICWQYTTDNCCSLRYFQNQMFSNWLFLTLSLPQTHWVRLTLNLAASLMEQNFYMDSYLNSQVKLIVKQT